MLRIYPIAIAIVVAALTASPACAPAAETSCPGGFCRPPGSSQSLLESPPHPAVVRVVVADASGGRSYGSGTLIDGDWQDSIVLTCAHLFEHGSRTATVQFADGRSATATLLESDAVWDLAALGIATASVGGVTVADGFPKPGETITSCGFGPDGRYMCNRGRVLGYAQTGGTQSHETLQWSGTARQGDSGGPALDARGRLVAVLWGTDGRTVAGTYCGRVQKFLAHLLPRRQPPTRPLVPIGPPPSEETPPDGNVLQSLRQRLDILTAGLDEANRQSIAGRQSLAARLDRIETAVAVVASLRRKIDDVAALVHETPSPGAAETTAGLGSVLLALLPKLLAALGWTGPPSVAAIVAARLLVGAIRRRRSRAAMKTPGSMSATPAASDSILSDDYARQLAGVFALSGRSPLADATLGREYDEELRRAEESTDGTLAAWAKKLRRRVATRFYRIHGQTPSPAEPAGTDEG